MTDTSDQLAKDLADAAWLSGTVNDGRETPQDGPRGDPSWTYLLGSGDVEKLMRISRRHRELAETVAKLPWCWDLHDGEWVKVPVVNGMAVWSVVRGNHCAPFVGCAQAVMTESDEWEYDHDLVKYFDDCYASRAAAEAAMRGEGPDREREGASDEKP